MAQKFCSFCCCSFCTSPSPSTPQSSQRQHQQPISSHPPHQTITAHSSSSPQQPISSPPPHQTITAHSSSSPQQPISSHPRNQTITAHSSSSPQHHTTTMEDFKIFLKKYSDINQINTLIPLLEELLKIASGGSSDGEGSTSAAGPFIQDGHRMLEMLHKRIGKRPLKKNSGDGTVEEIEKVFIELLKGSEKIPTVGIALSMLGSVFERFSNVSENRKECLYVLERIVDLGKQIMKLNEVNSDEKNKLDDGVRCIVEGSIMCISQLGGTIISSWFTAAVNKENLNAFHRKVDHFYANIQLSTAISMEERVIGIADRLPKIVPESQELYEYETVGIEEVQKRVIQLLDLNSQDTRTVVVVVYGIGGIGKTTLADAVYAHLDLQSYKHCRVHMEQGCTKNDLNRLQEKILCGLFNHNGKLSDCDEGQTKLRSLFKKYSAEPLFLYIDNALKCTDLERLLPNQLDRCLPPKSRILITTRDVKETDIFVGRNIVRREYDVNPLPDVEARKLLLDNVSNYDDEANIVNLLKLCGGVPLLLKLAGSQLANNEGNTRNIRNIVLEMLNEGKPVKERDISNDMVGFVYDRLEEPVQQAFLDIVSFFYNCNDFSYESNKYVFNRSVSNKYESNKYVFNKYVSNKYVSSIVGEEEFRALKSASFVKASEEGEMIVHDIVRARGKMLSEGNRLANVNTLLECLNDDKKLEQLRGIYFDKYEKCDQGAIEINCHHLNCMRHSLRVLQYNGSQITFREKCQKPFEQLRYLRITGDVPDLPMEFEKLKHLIYYNGPFTQGMNFYEFPPSLRFMSIKDCSASRVTYSKAPPKVTQPSSLVKLTLSAFKNMPMLPDGVEMLTKLESLFLINCPNLRELPCKLTELSNLKDIDLYGCDTLKELPSTFGELKILETLIVSHCFGLVKLSSDFGQLQNLENLEVHNCPKLVKLPSDFSQLKNLKNLLLVACSKLVELPSDFSQLKNLKKLWLMDCSGLVELPSDFGQLQNLENLRVQNCPKLVKLPSDFSQLKNLKNLWLGCSGLVELPSDFGELQNLENLILRNCSMFKKLPSDFGQLQNLEDLDLENCSELEELPSDFSQLKNLKELNLINCSKLEKWPSNFGDLTEMRRIKLSGCLRELEDSLPRNMEGIIQRW